MSQPFIIIMWVVNSTDQYKIMVKFKVSAGENLYDLSEKNPYKTLYLSVILQALVDLSKPVRDGEASEVTDNREEAHSWFFTSCEDFENICFYAGLAPEKVRGFAYEAIESKGEEDVKRKFSKWF